MSEQEQPDVEPSEAAPTNAQDAALQSRILATVDGLAPILVSGPLEELEVESGDLVVRLAKPRTVAAAAPGCCAWAAVQTVIAPAAHRNRCIRGNIKR